MLLFPASTLFIICIIQSLLLYYKVQEQIVFCFLSCFFLPFNISCLCFLCLCSAHSIVLSENTHAVSIIYGPCVRQGENRPHHIVSLLCGLWAPALPYGKPLQKFFGHFVYDQGRPFSFMTHRSRPLQMATCLSKWPKHGTFLCRQIFL